MNRELINYWLGGCEESLRHSANIDNDIIEVMRQHRSATFALMEAIREMSDQGSPPQPGATPE